MKKLMTSLATCAFATILGVASTPAFAQSENEQATFTLTEVMDVGSVTLQPGTYRINVVLIDSNRDMLRVTSSDQTKVYTTVLTRPHPILENEVIPASRYVSWATPPGQPRALRTWFARNRGSGHDIVYPQKRAMELAALAREPVIAISDEVQEAEYGTAPLLVVTPERQVKPYGPALALTPPRAAPVVVAEALPARLPRTASSLPLYAALGLLSLAGAFGLRILTSRA